MTIVQSKTIKLGIVMDPISKVKVTKDSSMAMMLEAQSRGYEIYYMEMQDLYLDRGQARANNSKIKVFDDAKHCYELSDQQDMSSMNLSYLMRKISFDTSILGTYILNDQVKPRL